MTSLRTFAIVGAGPAGLYLAQNIRRLWPEAEIDVIDRLPVPFGLVRYGVAPDHQGTKAVARQFERLFERDGVTFFPNVEVGRTISLEELRTLYDVVVLACGLAGDRKLGVPGEDLAGVYGSGAFTRWINEHPDEVSRCFDLGVATVVIGAGNVALDVARILAKAVLAPPDIGFDDKRCAAIGSAGLRTIDVVARGPAEAARFSPSLLKEFARLDGLSIDVDFAGEPSEHPNCAALLALAGHEAGKPRLTLRFRFNHVPVAIGGDERVRNVMFRHAATGEETMLKADALITAIGFEDSPQTSLRRARFADGWDALPPRLERGLFAVGWFRRGPQGTIPDNRADAKIVADAIAAEAPDIGGGRPGRSALRSLLASRGIRLPAGRAA